MMSTESILMILAAIGFTITALLTLVRIVIGPTILDRMVASDVLVTTLMIAVGADMVMRGHTDNIALMVILAATVVFGTVMVALYVRRRRNVAVSEKGEPRV